MLRLLAWTPGLAALIIATLSASPCRAAQPPQTDSTTLIRLAASEFPNLTHTERALLEFADVKKRARGDFATAGPSAVPNDPSNDPAHADRWDHDREVRAELIQWLCVDPDVSRLVDPRGIRLLGARVTGKLDLSHIRIPFGIAMIRCSIPEQINLNSAEIPKLNFNGSSTGEILAENIVVAGDADIGSDGTDDYGGPFRASGRVDLWGARVDGTMFFGGGKFHASAAPVIIDPEQQLKIALDLRAVAVKGYVVIGFGFESQGAVLLEGATIGGRLICMGGHFINPGNVALTANSASIGGDVSLAGYEQSGDFEADGLVRFVTAHVGGNFYVHQAKFKGARASVHGLDATAMEVQKALVWQKVDLQNGATLNLAVAKVAFLVDDEQSWPKPGDLILDGFAYSGLTPPVDAPSRLRWLALQPPGLHLQPYRQLAKVLRETGDEPGALEVLIAEEDARYLKFGFLGALWGGFLKWTIGYGHRPLLAIAWSLAVVLLGWGLVRTAERAGVMRPTWPENRPANFDRYERLSPFLYSIDVFVPFVNLHQERYWWPDADAAGQLAILGRKIRISGRWLRRYLWLQIIAGWILSAILVAGVTGLLRND